MTREEFQRKVDDGTLTVGELLTNIGYADLDQRAVICPPVVETLRRVAEKQRRQLADVTADVLKALATVRDVAEDLAETDALDRWASLTPDETPPDR